MMVRASKKYGTGTVPMNTTFGDQTLGGFRQCRMGNCQAGRRGKIVPESGRKCKELAGWKIKTAANKFAAVFSSLEISASELFFHFDCAADLEKRWVDDREWFWHSGFIIINQQDIFKDQAS